MMKSILTTGLLAASAVMAAPSPSMRRRGGSFSGGNEVVAYWGSGRPKGPDGTDEGAGNKPLSQLCEDENVDIVVIGFVNYFPEQSGNRFGWPNINIGNQCGSQTFAYPDTGAPSGLYSFCPDVGPGIDQCQAAGKKVLLSLGGAYPQNQLFTSKDSAEGFATTLWNMFGPGSDVNTPRPFGEAAVDGFDLDIESSGASPQTLQAFYPDFVAKLRDLYTTSSKPHYISAAPQCVIPDEHFSTYIQSSWFDYIFVQLYNTQFCSARAEIDSPSSNLLTFNEWVSQDYENNNVKVFAGLPGDPLASNGLASGSQYYLNQNEIKTLVNKFKDENQFGGIMVWEASYAQDNLKCGHNFFYWAKRALNEIYAGNTDDFPEQCQVSSSSVVHISTSSAIPSASASHVPASSDAIISSSAIPSVVPSSSEAIISSSAIHDISSVSVHDVSSSVYIPSSSAVDVEPVIPTSSSHVFPSHAPFSNSSSSVVHIGGPRPTTSLGGHGSPILPSNSGYESGPYPSVSKGSHESGPYPVSSKAGHGSHPKPTATKTSTSVYTDVCETGLTTKTATWTKTCYEGEDDSAKTSGLPDGWTVTVTVCTACAGKPTVTVTKPCDTPSAVPAKPTYPAHPAGGDKPSKPEHPAGGATLVVVVTPVPQSEAWKYVPKPAATSAPIAAPVGGSKGSDSDAYPVPAKGADSGYGAKPEYDAKPVAGASPVTNAAKPAGTGGYTKVQDSKPAQFTGAASRMSVGLALFGGLAIAALAF